jgi:hypothetical protein
VGAGCIRKTNCKFLLSSRAFSVLQYFQDSDLESAVLQSSRAIARSEVLCLV